MYTTFALHVQQRPIRISYETRGVDLVQDADTREVYGVIAERDGRRVALKANRAIVLCTGG